MTHRRRLPRARRGRAFSMIELSVVLVMVGIIGAAAAAVASLVLDAVRDVRQQAALGQRAQQPVVYIMNEVLRAGGNGMPGAASVVVENNCTARGELPDCDGGDRITLFAASRGPVCKATATGPDRFRLEWPQGGCCFRTPDFSAHLMLQQDAHTDRPRWRPVHVHDVGTCEFEAIDVLPPALLPAGATAMTTADAILVEMRTFYRDPTTTELFMLLDTEAPRAPGEPTVVGKRMLVSDRIYDLQFSVGVDVNDDGDVAEAEFAYVGDDTVPGDLRILPPTLVWMSVVAGMDKRGEPISAVSPLRGDTLTMPGLRLRQAGMQVHPLNGELGAGFSLAGVAGGP